MKIAKSLRFRIIAGYILFTLITTVCYTLSVLLVVKMNEDELFNWHIVRVAESEYNRYKTLPEPDRQTFLIENNIVIGDDIDIINYFKDHSYSNKEENVIPVSLDDWPDVTHISRGDHGDHIIYEFRYTNHSFHVVKISLNQATNQSQGFYYIVDISGYNKYDVWAVQGTYFGLFMLLLVFMMVAISLGVGISRKVISPLTQLTEDVEKATVGGKLNSYYPDEVGILAIKINDLMTRISCFIDREKAFSRDVSHELRTPVTSSQVALELAMHLTEKEDPKLREVLGRIWDANCDMVHLIETFMLIGRENIPSTAVTPTNLASVVSESIERNSYLLNGRQIDAVNMIDQHITVNQPHKLLSVVIDNILRNAFQYTEKGNVTVRASEKFISVADTGRGFDVAATERLLKPYETFHGEGIGLGLNIIKRICDLTGWKLEVKSECGVGSLLIIHF